MSNENYEKLEKVLRKENIPTWVIKSLILHGNCYIKASLDNNDTLYSKLQEIFGNTIECESTLECEGYILTTSKDGKQIAQTWVYSKVADRF